MEKLQMVYNRVNKTIQVLEPEVYELYKENPMYQIIDFTEKEFDGLSVAEFAKVISKKLDK